MNQLIFINYRREDTSPVARALAETLRYRLGADKVFLDEDSIREGEPWPERIQGALASASVVLALIGRNWLTASDRFGRRRLDDKKDWVRQELRAAKKQNIKVIPVLVGESIDPPAQEGLPKKLQWLNGSQAIRLHNDDWHNGVARVVETLISKYGFTDILKNPELPIPSDKKSLTEPLSDKDLVWALSQLSGWEPIQTTYPPRREIRKIYHFKSFRSAIEFMHAAMPLIEETPVHHPRWENQYKAVTVYFSTWDVGSKVTQYDVDAAKKMDGIYESFKKAHKRDGQEK